jgi:hypothetical protein
VNTEPTNTDPAETQSLHLDLEDLIAAANGRPADARVSEHLAACERCRVEAGRWSLVADGVRGLAAATPEVTLPEVPTPALPRVSGPRVPGGSRRRGTLVASAAASLVLIGGASYGATALLTGHAPGTAKTGAKPAALTAVAGCAAVRQADGTLTQVNDNSLVIKTGSGQSVTVTTTGSTKLSMSEAPLSDITDGTSVIVTGHGSAAAIAADDVSVESPPPGPFGARGKAILELPPGIVGARGTVADASAAGFTVVTSDGTRVQVTISSRTDVRIPRASLSQLQVGAPSIAVGYPEQDGSLSALVVLSGRPGIVDVRGCSPAQIDAATTTAFVSGG